MSSGVLPMFIKGQVIVQIREVLHGIKPSVRVMFVIMEEGFHSRSDVNMRLGRLSCSASVGGCVSMQTKLERTDNGMT